MSFRRAAVAYFVLLCSALSVAWGQGAAGAQASAQHLSVELVVPPQQLAAGGSAWAGLHFTLEPGWHIYWRNAGDSGEPPEVKWTLPAGVTAEPFLYPTPHRLPLGPLMDFGYEHQVVFPLQLKVAPGAQPGPATLAAKVRWLVCREACLPGSATLSLVRPVVAAGAAVQTDRAAAALVASGQAALPAELPPGGKAVLSASGKSLTLAVLTGKPEAGAQFFPLQDSLVANAAPQPARALRQGVALTLTRDENAPAAAPAELAGVVVLADGRSFAVDARPGTIPAGAPAASRGGAGAFLQAVALAFAGGLILNLMPCVFPVLFLKGLSLVESSRSEQGRMRAHGWVYALGITLSFWLVLGVLLGLRAAGGELGWGFQFQSPGFVAVMALFLFFLALSLAGMFEIGLSLTSAGSGLAARGGYAGSFFTGVLATVVATPCTAPLMGAAIGFALSASPVVSFGVFTALALGLACPYLLLAYFPAWTRVLPRPGAWMEVLKQATAVPVFGTVIWLVWLFAGLTGANALLGLLAGFLLLGVAGWVLGRWPARLGAGAVAVAVLAVAVALPLVAVRMFGEAPGAAAAGAAAGAPGDKVAWTPWTPSVVAKLQAEGKPVFVDFTANWCLSCQVNERVVLDRADVQGKLRSSGVALVRADWTRHDGDITEALEALGRSGIPAYALYPAQPGAAPTLLPEVLTPGIVFSALDAVKAPAAARSLQAGVQAAP